MREKINVKMNFYKKISKTRFFFSFCTFFLYISSLFCFFIFLFCLLHCQLSPLKNCNAFLTLTKISFEMNEPIITIVVTLDCKLIRGVFFRYFYCCFEHDHPSLLSLQQSFGEMIVINDVDDDHVRHLF